MFSRLTREHAIKITERLVSAIEATPLRPPRPGEGEERYVAAELEPRVRACVTDFRGLTLRGEGLQQPYPVTYLGYLLYPDLAVAYYDQLLVAVEAKFVEFSDTKGDLATAVGQCAIYSSAGYKSALGILIGTHSENTRQLLRAENERLRREGFPWRLCTPDLRLP